MYIYIVNVFIRIPENIIMFFFSLKVSKCEVGRFHWIVLPMLDKYCRNVSAVAIISNYVWQYRVKISCYFFRGENYHIDIILPIQMPQITFFQSGIRQIKGDPT